MAEFKSHLDENGFVVLDDQPEPAVVDDRPPHLAHAAIAACQLCDPDGYTTTGHVCDHHDHRAAADRGMELVREALEKRDTP